MRFHASLRASHYFGGFSDIQFLPVTQHEGLTLTQGQGFYCFFNNIKDLLLLQLFRRACGHLGLVFNLHGFQRIGIFVTIATEQVTQRGDPCGADFLTAEKIPNGILQNPLKKHRELGRRTVRVFF